MNALSWKHVTTYTFAVGGGAVGVGGAVSIWSVGTAPTSSYDDGKGDSGNARNELGSGAGDPASSADGQVQGDGNGYQSILDNTTPSSTSGGVAGKAKQRVDGNTSATKTTIHAKGERDGLANRGRRSRRRSTRAPARRSSGTSRRPAASRSVPTTTSASAASSAQRPAAPSASARRSSSAASMRRRRPRSGGTAVISSGGPSRSTRASLENTSTLAFAGAGGAVGVGAQVTVLNDGSSQWAKIDDGAQITRAVSGIDVKAENANRSVSALAIGGAIGGVAAGVAIGVVNLTGSTKASVGTATIGATGTVSSLTVEAHDNSTARTQAIAVAAGIGVALSGAVALTHVHPSEVSATLAGGASITVTGAINVTAEAKPNVTSEAFGVAVAGGAGLGISIASATNDVNVSATVTAGSHFSVGSLSVAATLDLPTGLHAKNAYANSVAGAGGILLGASGAVSNAETSGSVSASLGNNTFLPNGDVTVTAFSRTRTQADATGVAIGFIGIGAAIANATSDVDTSASIGSNLNTNTARNGDLTIGARGIATTASASTAGSGGVISGNASVANSEDTGTSSATLGATSHAIHAADVTISSQNDSDYYHHSDSTNAAVVGAAGAFASSDLNTSSTVTLPSNLTINATGVVQISALDTFIAAPGGTVDEPEDNVNAAGGGGISLTAAESTTNITGHATVTIGSNLTITAVNAPETNLASIGIDAGTQVLANDTVNLATGGAISGAGVDSSVTANLFSLVNIGTGVNLYSTQNIGVGTYTIVVGHQEADSETWGLAAVGFADASLTVNSHETINIGTGAQFTALGDVNIRARRRLDRAQPDEPHRHHERTVLRDRPDRDPGRLGEHALQHHAADERPGIVVHSGRNTTIGANPHNPTASADGTGHGYELGFIPVTDGSSDPEVNSTANVVVNGTVIAGFYHQLTADDREQRQCSRAATRTPRRSRRTRTPSRSPPTTTRTSTRATTSTVRRAATSRTTRSSSTTCSRHGRRDRARRRLRRRRQRDHRREERLGQRLADRARRTDGSRSTTAARTT